MDSIRRIEDLAAKKAKAKKAATTSRSKGMPPVKGFQGGVGKIADTPEGRLFRKNQRDLYKNMNK